MARSLAFDPPQILTLPIEPVDPWNPPPYDPLPPAEPTYQLQPSKRLCIAYLADRVAYIPLVGTAVGLMRIATCFIAVVLAGLAGLACRAGKCLQNSCRYDQDYQESEWAKTCYYVVRRSLDEIKRGRAELLPFSTLCLDWKLMESEADGMITGADGPYGRYVYSTPVGFMYSYQPIDRQVYIRPRNRDVHCAQLA